SSSLPTPPRPFAANGAPCEMARDCVSGSCGGHRCSAWSASVVGAGPDATTGVAVLPDGDVVITGWFDATIDLGCGPMATLARGKADIFVARFAREGHCVWSRRFGGAADDLGWAIVATAGGHVVVAGNSM